MCVHVSAYSQCQIPFCYTDGLLSAGRGITVPRNSLVWRLQTAPAQDKLYRTPNFAGAFRYNAQKNCATRVCRACVDETTCVAVRYLALRIGRRKGRTRSWSVRSRGRILCRSLISQRSHVGNLRQTLQGKGVIHKRVETAGVYPLVRPRGVSATPPLRLSKKDCRPDRVNRPRGSSTPLGRCRKGAARQGTNTLTQFVCPAKSVPRKKREPSHEGSLKNQVFRFRKYPRYITAAAMLQKYAIIYGTSKIFSK